MDLRTGVVAAGNALPSVGLAPEAVAVDGSTGRLYVATMNNEIAVVNETTFAVMDWINLGGPTSTPAFNGVGLGLDPADHRLYVARESTPDVTVINTTTDAIEASLFTMSGPQAVIYDPTLDTVYILDTAANAVTRINASTDTVVGSVVLGSSPVAGAYDPLNGELYVSELGQNAVQLVNASTGALGGTAGTGREPDGIAYDPANRDMYVANIVSNNVSVFSANTLTFVANIGVAGAPRSAVYDPVHQRVYIADSGSAFASTFYLGQLSVINTSTNALAYSVLGGIGPWGEAMDPSHGLLLATDLGDLNLGLAANVTVFNTTLNRSVGSIDLGVLPYAVAYDPLKADYLTANGPSDNVSIVSGSTNRIQGSLPAGLFADGVAYDGADGNLFVANAGSDNLTEINGTTLTVQGSVPVGTTPVGVTYIPATRQLYSLNLNSNNVTVLNASTLALQTSLVTGRGPDAITYIPSSDDLFITNSLGTQVTVVNASTDSSVGSFSFGTAPEGVAYDPDTGEAWVAFLDNGLVYSVNPKNYQSVRMVPANAPDALTFDPANGLLYAPDQSRNVSAVDGVNETSLVGFPTGAGPRQLALGATGATLYVPDSEAGAISVVAAPTIDRFPIQFNETGLPAGTAWTVRLDGVNRTTTSAQLLLDVPNGTYTWQANASGYAVNVSSGNVVVNGTAVNVQLRFLSRQYLVQFQEQGLTAGNNWNVTFAGVGKNLTTTGASDTLTFGPMTNGTFRYLVADVPGWRQHNIPYSGNVTVSGLEVTVSMTFTRTKYAVEFTEEGLPALLNWTVSFNGTTRTNTSNGGAGVLTFPNEPNGSYSYSITDISGWHQSSAHYSGNVRVQSGPLSVQLTYYQVQYALVFVESGLLPGTAWTVLVGGMPYTTSGPTVGIGLGNGTYGYSVSPEKGYEISPDAGTTVITGGNQTRAVAFTDLGPDIFGFAATQARPRVGQTTTLSVNATGGAGSLTYTYLGLPAGCLDRNVSSLVCIPTQTGTYVVTVTVDDQLGLHAMANLTLEVEPGASGTGGTLLGLPSTVGIAVIVAVFVTGLGCVLWIVRRVRHRR